VSQQVNLYQPVFRRQKRKFSAVTMLQATALVVLVVGAMYGYTWWQVRSLRAEAANTDRQLAAVTRKLEDTSRQFGERLPSKELQSRIRETEARIAEKQGLQQVLRAAEYNTQGFSEFFIAFARQHTPGVWLTGFDIVGAGEQLTLSGRSTQPELVPRYLQRLSAEKRLSGTEFQTFQMSRAAGAAAYVEFLAKTGVGDAPAAPEKGAP
jgi:hypothetical protein